jgi:hypothetical protein
VENKWWRQQNVGSVQDYVFNKAISSSTTAKQRSNLQSKCQLCYILMPALHGLLNLSTRSQAKTGAHAGKKM